MLSLENLDIHSEISIYVLSLTSNRCFIGKLTCSMACKLLSKN